MFARFVAAENGLEGRGWMLAYQNKSKTDFELIQEIQEEARNTLAGTIDLNSTDSKILRAYLKIAIFSRKLTQSAEFGFAVIFIILLAGLTIGIESYPSMAHDPTLNGIDFGVSILFALECVLKIIAEGLKPHRYFIGPGGYMNCLDVFVVIACFPFISDFFYGNAAVIRIVTRLFRLVRLTKLFQRLPALNVIIRGLIGGLKSISYIAILMVLVLYLYAVLGVYLFRANDPFGFRSISVALLTLFQAMTLDSWGDRMLVNSYGCHQYSANTYFTKTSFSDSGYNSSSWADLPNMYKCTSPLQQPLISAVYFISYIAISALILLSLFVGTVTMSMQESMEEMRRKDLEIKRKKALYRTMETLSHMMDSSKFNDNQEGTFICANLSIIKELKAKCSQIYEYFCLKINSSGLSRKERLKARGMQEMMVLLNSVWGQDTSEYSSSKNAMTVDFSGAKSPWAIDLFCSRRYIGSFCTKMVDHYLFNVIVIVCIVYAAVLAGLQTEYESSDDTFYVISNYVISSLFLLEIVIRIAAEEFYMFEYFSQPWNMLDFVIVVLSLVPGGGAYITILRLVRILRVLKLVNALPGLAVIVNALIIGISSIGYIGVIIGLTYYIFALLAMVLFQDNDFFHFGTLHATLLTLFDIATLDNWGDIMYIQVYGCDVFPFGGSGYPYDSCRHSTSLGLAAVVFFVVFIIIGALVMLTLFVGVVTTSMEFATKQQLLDLGVEKRLVAICTQKNISLGQVAIYKRVFNLLDLDRSGTIDEDELWVGLNRVGIKSSMEEFKAMFSTADLDKDGQIDLVEFFSLMELVKQTQKHMHLTTPLDANDEENPADAVRSESSSESSSSYSYLENTPSKEKSNLAQFEGHKVNELQPPQSVDTSKSLLTSLSRKISRQSSNKVVPQPLDCMGSSGKIDLEAGEPANKASNRPSLTSNGAGSPNNDAVLNSNSVDSRPADSLSLKAVGLSRISASRADASANQPIDSIPASIFSSRLSLISNSNDSSPDPQHEVVHNTYYNSAYVEAVKEQVSAMMQELSQRNIYHNNNNTYHKIANNSSDSHSNGQDDLQQRLQLLLNEIDAILSKPQQLLKSLGPLSPKSGKYN